MSLIVLLQARNEERNLPGWFANIGDSVDGIVALDDGSTDRTAELLRAHPKLLSLLQNPPGGAWDERRNQIRLLEEGRRHGAAWFLTLDADERVEKSFRARVGDLIARAEADGGEAYLFSLRELWSDRHHYRCDGFWKDKAQYRLFRNVVGHGRFGDRPFHRDWMPIEISERIETVGRTSGLEIYHLKMIAPEARLARAALYEALDPEHRLQPRGYAYLTDERRIRRRRIPASRGFLPADDPGVPSVTLSGRLRDWRSRLLSLMRRAMGRD